MTSWPCHSGPACRFQSSFSQVADGDLQQSHASLLCRPESLPGFEDGLDCHCWPVWYRKTQSERKITY